jgi:hypothetical protein
MPTYTIYGKRIKADEPLSEQEIEEIAAELSGKPVTQPKASITSGFLMGLKDPITAGAQMLPRGLELLSSLGGAAPNRVSQFFGSEAQRMDALARQEEESYQAARKAEGGEGFDWSRLGGNVLNPVNLAVGARVGTALKTASPLVQAAGVGAASGVLQPVVSGDSFSEEKLKQGAIGTAGGVVGAAATKAAGKALNPLVSKAEQTMRDLGVTMTPGQLAGGQARGIEEFAEKLPLIGQYISNAKERQLYQFNQGVINKALGKVKQKLPADVVGRDAVAEANKIISQQYDDVLSKISYTLDGKTTTGLSNVVRTSKLASASDKQKLNDLIDFYIYQKIPVGANKTGTITGQSFKGIESDMLKRVQSLRSSQTDADRVLGEELGRALDVFKSAMRSQNPQQASVLRRIDSAYGDLAVMRTAAAKTKNGVFTPEQYQIAVRQRDTTRSKSAFSAGMARGQDVADAAVDTIGRDAASTLEGRLAMIAGGGYGAYQIPEVMGAVGVAVPAVYSEKGMQVMQALMRSRPDIAKKIGAKLTERATKEGSITGAQILDEYNRMTKAEE